MAVRPCTCIAATSRASCAGFPETLIYRRCIEQLRKHALEAHQFGCRLGCRQTQPVLGYRACRNHPYLEKILRHNVKVAAPAW